MKRNFLILMMILFALSAGAQQIKQEVISSAGGFNVASGNTISISWTLGETIIPTFTSSDGTLILTHGFQQKYIITAVEENFLDPVQVTVFPNPASDIVNIEFDTPTDGEIKLFLLDTQGRLVKTDQIEAAVTNKQINLQDLSTGIYYLRLVKGKLVNVYKVIKL
ncbi:MAG: hypothetical protein C0408_01825 [Odoribacter sp.]|nr:hypothetical protein [Odoribacter sp.]